jgi:hypothetical protein
MFNTTEDAMAAVAAFEPLEFDGRHLRVITSTPDYVSGNYLVKKGVFPAHAEATAAQIRAGGVLLIVDQPIGYTEAAMEILAAAAPHGANAASVVNESCGFDEKTALSSLMGWDLLIPDPTPFASFWNLPTLAKSGWAASEAFGMKLLSSAGPVLSVKALTKSGPVLPF